MPSLIPIVTDFLTSTVFAFLGGRFKKEVVIDNQSYLLLIRDEGSEPDPQVFHYSIHQTV